MIKVCNLCGGVVTLAHHRRVYGKAMSEWPWIYLCRRCGGYVGVHKGTYEPLGTLADKPTRKARHDAHAAFDPLWKFGSMSRNEAYAWLAEQLGIPVEQCHIGLFDIGQCEKVVEVMKKELSHDTSA